MKSRTFGIRSSGPQIDTHRGPSLISYENKSPSFSTTGDFDSSA
jgi:hypothetical protein